MSQNEHAEERDAAYDTLEAAVLGVNFTLDDRADLPATIAAPLRDITVSSDGIPSFAEIERLVQPQPQPIETAGAGFWGSVAALSWVGAALGAPLAVIGFDALQYQHPAVLIGIVAVAIAPAVLILFTAAGAREAQRVRRETTELARLLSPTDIEGRARTVGQVVRAEIDALQVVVESALGRFAALEAAAQRNALVFDQAVSHARDGAGILSQTLQHERHAFEELTHELRMQSDSLGENVGRHVRLMREASHLVRQEYVGADETLQEHLASFTAAASLMAERTQAFDGAAAFTHAAAQRLDGVIVNALEALTHATSLTDTARQSAESASQAANATALAVRETTTRAVADARRVAHMIRSETEAMEGAATATLAKLKAAAEEAHRASEEAQAAADRHAGAIQRRLSAMAGAAQAASKSVAIAEPIAQQDMQVAETMVAAAGGRARRILVDAPRMAPDTAQDWTPPPSANDAGPASGGRSPADAALEMLAHVGLLASDVFAAADLDFIAGRARQGGAARRHAVSAAAPDAVARLQHLFAHNVHARSDAMAFRAKPDLATQAGGKQVLVAYLLVDAALG